MYFIRRCWFLKCSEEIHYVPIGHGDMWYYVPLDDGWEEALGRNVYIMSQYFSPNAKYWTASSGNRTQAPPDRMWTLYHWAMESVHNMGVLTSQYFSQNAKYWTASSGNRTPAPPDRMWTLYHWAMESVHNMGVLTSQYFSPNDKYWTASSGNRTRDPPDRMWTLYHWSMESVHNMGVLVSWPPGRGQILCNYSIAPPPPTHQQASMYTYTMEGEGEPCQPAPSPWIPAHTTQLQGDLRSPLTHNNTQEHPTTDNNTHNGTFLTPKLSRAQF
jgi:hypothetical protein